jgi:putative salt-induced outer membrane protein
MNMILRFSSIATLMLVSGVAAADGWTGKGDAGVVVNRGNTDNTNIGLGLELKNESDQWRHTFDAKYLRNESTVFAITAPPAGAPAGTRATVSEVTTKTADYLGLGWKSDYKLSDRSYVFGALRYETDEFGPYDHQYIGSIGYGYNAIKNDTTTFDLEAGVGSRRVKDNLFGDSSSDIVFRGGAKFAHKFNENVEFTNTFLAEAGADNTFLSNDASVSVKMSDKLSLKTGVFIRHNTDVPATPLLPAPAPILPGVDKTDTTFSTGLVYSF